MELEELRIAWRALEERAEAVQVLNLSVLKRLKLAKTRSAVRRLACLPLIDLAGGVLATLLLGSFLAEHVRTARLAIPALVLHALALLVILISVRQLALIGRIDYSAPVVTIQRTLLELRTLRVRMTQW